MTGEERKRLQDALAAVHRKHRLKWLTANCACGWKHDLMSFTDHSDHVARVLACAIEEALA